MIPEYPGVYILITKLPKDCTIRTKAREFYLKKGFYAYIGSAKFGIARRIKRYIYGFKKKFWHIDYLLEKGKVLGIYVVKGKDVSECEVARRFSKLFCSIPRFGASDCRCKSHLFFSKRWDDFYVCIENSISRSFWYPIYGEEDERKEYRKTKNSM